MNGRKGPLSFKQIFTIQIKARKRVEIRKIKIGMFDEINKSLWELTKDGKKFEFKWGGVRIKIIINIRNIVIIDGNRKLISNLEFWEVAEK